MIESLENNIQSLEEELRSLMVGEMSYYQSSLKAGVDCRETGLSWILKYIREMIGEK